jgi:hypothetical protein
MQKIKFLLTCLSFVLCIHFANAQERKVPELTKTRLELYISSFKSVDDGFKTHYEKYKDKLQDADGNDPAIVAKANADKEKIFTSNGWKGSKDYEDVSSSIALAKQVVDAEKAMKAMEGNLDGVPDAMKPQMLEASKSVVAEAKAQMKSFGMTDKELALVRANYKRIEAL